MKNVTVTVSGTTASGKTIVAAAIFNQLLSLGFNVGGQKENQDGDLMLKCLGIKSHTYGHIIPQIKVQVNEVQTIREKP